MIAPVMIFGFGFAAIVVVVVVVGTVTGWDLPWPVLVAGGGIIASVRRAKMPD
jgi:hypothetical protein